MNKPIINDVTWFDVFVWCVRAVAVGALVYLVFGCSMNYANVSTNPVCIASCTAQPATAASGISIEQSIQREGARDVGQP